MIKRTVLLLAVPLAFYMAVHGRASHKRQTMEPVQQGPGISLVTLNTAKEGRPGRMLRELQANPALRGADVMLFQEVKHEAGEPQCTAEQLAAGLGLHVAYSSAAPGVNDQGLAILSRYPLRDISVRSLKPFDLRFHSRARFALAATAASPWGAVRIFNAHLDTRLNTRERLEQLEPILRDSEAFAGPSIIGGDFNSNGFYWIGHVLPLPAPGSQAEGVAHFMTAEGYRAAVPPGETTFDYLGMHLDWVWLRGLEPRAWRVYPLEFSDHHAVWARIAFP